MLQIQIIAEVIGKVKAPYKVDGVEKFTYKLNISQDNGNIIEKLRVNQLQYDLVEKGQSVKLQAVFGTSKGGNNYIQIKDIDIIPPTTK